MEPVKTSVDHLKPKDMSQEQWLETLAHAQAVCHFLSRIGYDPATAIPVLSLALGQACGSAAPEMNPEWSKVARGLRADINDLVLPYAKYMHLAAYTNGKAN
jgi:hypothetical protein